MIKDNDKSGKVVFKDYQQHQISLLPPSLEELIPSMHLVRVINSVVDRIDLKILEQGYKGGGASTYHPRMMLKILLYAYSIKIYSCRRIDEALYRDVHFMWLSGMQRPDFRTINNFRSGALKSIIEKVFSEVLDFLMEQGYVKLENYFVDGTKLQADANKHTAVWAKNTARYKESLREKVKVLLSEIDSHNEYEDQTYGEGHFESEGHNSTLNSDQIHQKVAELNEKLSKISDKKEQQKVKNLQRKIQGVASKMEHYEHQERILKDRRSYSKTDPDATFMKMKDDQFLPAYNVMQGTENQFIVNYTITQSSAETHLLKDHLKKFEENRGRLPENIVGDAAYGSEENYAYLKENSCHAYLKYSGYYQEQTKAYRENIFHRDNFSFDPITDSFTCPNGEKLIRKTTSKQTNHNGYERTTVHYESRNCDACSFADKCKKSDQQRRQLTVNPVWEDFKKSARQRLFTDTGIKLRKQRSVDIESSFGDIKFNQGYSRFRLRGLPKVNIEWGLIAMSHNLRKAAIKAAA